MSKDPAFLFYPGDWLGGTMGMTFEEKGAYMELLMLQFNRGHMSGQVIGQTVGQIWERISFKFKIDDAGLFYNERLELEKDKRKQFVQSRRNNIAGVNQYTKKTGHIKGHMTSHMENEDKNENIIEYKDIIEGFNNTRFAKVQKLSDARKKHLSARIKEYGADKIKEVFMKADASDFLRGVNNNSWTATFDWIINPNNFVKIMEGNYDNKKTRRDDVSYPNPLLPQITKDTI